MTQLLCGIEHCHLRGIIHRDVKVSNILVNNQGILKLGDFGLANITSPKNRQPLTSRVVTLWYRPPELLMGSTNYGVSVDLWSVGCVFAELLLGKPILKGNTEVSEQQFFPDPHDSYQFSIIRGLRLATDGSLRKSRRDGSVFCILVPLLIAHFDIYFLYSTRLL